MRRNKTIYVTSEQLELATKSAFSLASDGTDLNVAELFYSHNLAEVEGHIKRLSEFSSKSWLLSAILLFMLVYSDELYKQSGLDWNSYMADARARLGLDQRDVTQMLSAARFFILYHSKLEDAGWTPANNCIKLARAELALSLCDDIDLTIEHLMNDTWDGFKKWYSSYKQKKQPALEENKFYTRKGKFFYDDTEVVQISMSIPPKERAMIRNCMTQVFTLLKQGKIPSVSEEL